MDAVAGRYERVFPVARYAEVLDLLHPHRRHHTRRAGFRMAQRDASGPGVLRESALPSNLLVRIDRQLYQARLLEEGRIALDRLLPRHLREKVGEYRMRV